MRVFVRSSFLLSIVRALAACPKPSTAWEEFGCAAVRSLALRKLTYATMRKRPAFPGSLSYDLPGGAAARFATYRSTPRER